MVQLLLEGHGFKNEAEDVIKLFYQKKDIIFVQKEPPEKDRGIFLCAKLVGGCGRTEIKCQLVTDTFTKSLSSQLQVEYPARTLNGKKQVKWELKRQIYLLLQEYTQINQPWGLLTGIRPSKIIHEMLDRKAEFPEIERHLIEYCRVSKSKMDLIWSVANTERKILENSSPVMVSLYIGIPFCVSRCLYCSFISDLVGRCGHLLGDYLKCLKLELDGIQKIIQDKELKLQSIYIGGGTPTSIGPKYLDELLSHVEKVFNFDSLLEFTLEAGRPDSIDVGILKIIKNHNVSRISINPQTMNDCTLKLIGRNHSSDDIVKAFELARKVGFDNINMDVIAGLPGENADHFRHTMEAICCLHPESLTVHTLSLKRGSKLIEDAENFKPTEVSILDAMVNLGREYAYSIGMHPYYLYRQKNILGNLENTGYCKPGFESVYNIQIMDERQTIFAAGAGAVTKVYYPKENRLERAFNVKNLDEYIKRTDEMLERKRSLFNVQHQTT